MRDVEAEGVKRVIAMARIRGIETLRICIWDGGDGFVLEFPDIPHTTVPKTGRALGVWLDRLRRSFRLELVSADEAAESR